MEREIRFCTSADGVRIGYCVVGKGRPLITVYPWGSSLEVNWYPFGYSSSHDNPMVIGFDRRGNGTSQRDVEDFTLAAQVGDIEAIADELRLDRFDLFGDLDGATIAAAFASDHPERIRRLILSAPYSHGGEIGGLDSVSGLIALVRGNWQLGRRALADVVFPRGPIEEQIAFANMLRQSMSADVAARHLEFQLSVDVRPSLPKIKAPTLIFHGIRDRRSPIAAGRTVALLISDARFVPLEGKTWETSAPTEQATALIRQFLGEAADAANRSDATSYPSLAVTSSDASSVSQLVTGPRPSNPEHLTPRELEVLRLIADGRTNAEISRELVLSLRTVARHITNIYGKIGARSKADATAYAIRHELTPD